MQCTINCGQGYYKWFVMKRYFLTLISCLATFTVAFAQAYTTYWTNNNGLSGKIMSRDKIVDYRTVRVKELRFYNTSSTPYTVIGYVKLKYTEISSGKTDYIEKRFNTTVRAYENYGSWVSTYFSPSWSRKVGYVDQLSFYIESCTPLNRRQTSPDNNNNNSNNNRSNNDASSVHAQGKIRKVSIDNRAFYYDQKSQSFIESESIWQAGKSVTLTGKYFFANEYTLFETTAIDNEHNSYWYIRIDCVE